MSDDIAYATIRALGMRYRKRELSPVEVTRTLLDRIAQLDPGLHAFVTLTADRALAEARAAEAALHRGDTRPLLGIPVAHKDIYCTRGIRTTGGSACWRTGSRRTTRRVCGAGRRRAPSSWASSSPTSSPSASSCLAIAFSPPATPGTWITSRAVRAVVLGPPSPPGWSSGATGSDTGGSIRGPAAFCGIVGLKPTYGRVSRAGVLTLSWTLDHAGPMARTVEDCAYLLQAMAGHDPADPASSRAPVDDYLAPLGRRHPRRAHRCAAHLFL